jgi:pimeloyl-ACP methyl ester carboxylesterase
MTSFSKTFHDLTTDEVSLRVAALSRPGARSPVVFMHGFGSTKKDYADVARHPAFDGRPFLAWDAPGCGETVCADLPAISVPFQVKAALALIDAAGFERFHLVGHSMGGRAGGDGEFARPFDRLRVRQSVDFIALSALRPKLSKLVRAT